MFKNKKVIALVLFAVMVLAPFAGAFAAPSHNHLKNYEEAADTLKTKAGDYESALKAYATSGSEADKKAVEEKKEAYDEALAAADTYKGLTANYKVKDFAGGTWAAAAPYAADSSGSAVYTDEAAAKTGLETADADYAEAKAKVTSDIVALYGKLGDLKAKSAGAGSEATEAKTALEAYVTEYTNTSYDDDQKALIAPYMEAAYKNYAKLAGGNTAKEWLAYQDASVVKALNGINVDESKKLEKDGYKVWAPDAAPEALNGAVELRLSKNDKGNTLMKLYDANGKEVESKGLLYVRMPIPKGVTANKIKVDGVETTFKVVDGTWEFAAEFKIAK